MFELEKHSIIVISFPELSQSVLKRWFSSQEVSLFMHVSQGLSEGPSHLFPRSFANGFVFSHLRSLLSVQLDGLHDPLSLQTTTEDRISTACSTVPEHCSWKAWSKGPQSSTHFNKCASRAPNSTERRLWFFFLLSLLIHRRPSVLDPGKNPRGHPEWGSSQGHLKGDLQGVELSPLETMDWSQRRHTALVLGYQAGRGFDCQLQI